MRARVVEDADVITYVVVCDPGDEAVAALNEFARSENLEAASITAVGAFERATVGWFDPAAKQFRRNRVNEQCELLPLIGDVAEGEDRPVVHMHVTLGLPDGTVRGGHLLEGVVFPTLEAVVTETPAHLRRVLRPDIGIALIDLGRGETSMSAGQFSRQEVVHMLRAAGLHAEADEAMRTLPDPASLDHVEKWAEKHGITRDTLIDRMGGSP